MNFTFLGRGGLLSSIVLKELIANQQLPSIVVIEDDLQSPYPNLTREVCENNNLEYQIYSDLNSEDATDAITGQEVDFVLVASLGSILQKDLLDKVPFFNVHMGVLPDYRGALTNFWKIKNGDDQYGVTIHKMAEKVDTGEVCIIKEQNFAHAINASQFFRENYKMAAQTVVEFISQYKEHGQPPKQEDVSENEGKYYPKFEEEDLRINISKSASFNYKFINRIQFYGYPYLEHNGEKHLIKSAHLLLDTDSAKNDNDSEISHISESTIVISNASGILELKL